MNNRRTLDQVRLSFGAYISETSIVAFIELRNVRLSTGPLNDQSEPFSLLPGDHG